MNFFRRIFGAKEFEPKPVHPPRDMRKLLEPLSEPSIHMLKTTKMTKSQFGGVPKLPKSISWPTKNEHPLTFLATLSLDEISILHSFEWLPQSGNLLFFYDIEEQAWGYDPIDKGSWQVIYVEDNAMELVEVVQPELLSKDLILPTQNIEFNLIQTFPSWERDVISSLDLTDEEFDLLTDIQTEVYKENPHHQIGGYPDPMQADQMEHECQLVSNGLYCGDSTGYEDPKAKELESGISDWRLLFQMDTDDDFNIMWGDAGLIYFWIRKQDAIEKSFEKTWLILQCG